MSTKPMPDPDEFDQFDPPEDLVTDEDFEDLIEDLIDDIVMEEDEDECLDCGQVMDRRGRCACSDEVDLDEPPVTWNDEEGRFT